ncbi:MAG TPA: xylulokinase [Nocardioidaceae bacterium]|nr:xylulokinase [Nocardioidaceae bacterium]
MTLVAGIDSSTQACKVMVVDAATGAVVRRGRAPHPDGTEVQPEAWLDAARAALADAGGLGGVAALSVAGQQHGMVCLDEAGAVVRPALLWNDVRSASAASQLVAELANTEAGGSGEAAWAAAVGSVPLAAFTVAKLRWLRDHEPGCADRTAAVCLPHDWLTWRLSGGADPTAVTTDRSDASGTGYWSPREGRYRGDLLSLALGSKPAVPAVLGPSEPAGTLTVPGALGGKLLGPGAGDNAAAALGLDAQPGDVVVSVGTSGVVSAVCEHPTGDPSGQVAGFADATGRYLPLACTLNAARVLQAAARLLGVGLAELSRLALRAPTGADGLVMVPYLDGERTPNRPDATGAVHGLRRETATPEHLARAAFEGVLCGLADALDAVRACGAPLRRVVLVGGGAGSEALRALAPAVLGCPVDVPAAGEYVARGAARQAAWALAGGPEPPAWQPLVTARYEADPQPAVRRRYRAAAGLFVPRPGV